MIAKKTLIAVCAASLFTMAGCKFEQTEEGSLPDVDVDAEGGNLPEYEVEQVEEGSLPDVDVDVEGGNLPRYEVDAPEVNVDTKEVTVEVPDVELEYDDPSEYDRMGDDEIIDDPDLEEHIDDDVDE